MKVLVLAAGFATRLYPLTRDRAKPLLDVAGRCVLTRLLADSVLGIEGLREVVVVSNHKFHHQFEAWAQDFECPVPLRVLDDGSNSDEDKRGGVADMALAWAEASRDDETEVLVIAGDNLLDFSLGHYAQTYRKLARPMMLVRHFPEGAPPGRFGEVSIDQTGRISRFREKPQQPESPYAATCIYFFPPSVRIRIAEYLQQGGEPDAPGHFVAWLSQQEEMHAVPFVGTAHDIGNLATLEAARAAYEGQQ